MKSKLKVEERFRKYCRDNPEQSLWDLLQNWIRVNKDEQTKKRN